MSTVLAQAVEELSGSTAELPSALRRLMVIASRIKAPDLSEWVRNELNGYLGDTPVPEYRQGTAYVRLHFLGPFGSSRTIQVGPWDLPEALRPSEGWGYLRQPVAALAELREGENDPAIALPAWWITAARDLISKGEMVSVECYSLGMVVRRLESLGLIIGPLLFALSPLFWIDGHYGVTGGLLIAIAAVPWVYGLIGEYNALRPRFPLLSGLWMLLVLIGMFGTVAFGLQGVFESVFGITEFRSLATFDIYPLPVAIVLILAGPLFPVALLSLGAMHWWTGLTPRWSAVLLVFAAAAFPVARISRSVPVAFIADLVMLAAFCVVAWFAWHRRDEESI